MCVVRIIGIKFCNLVVKQATNVRDKINALRATDLP
jgi:hypothetical protein